MTLQQQKNKNDVCNTRDEDDNYDSNDEKEDSTSSCNNDKSTTTNTTTVDNNILNYKNITNNSINMPIQIIKTKIKKMKKYLYLPRCSLLILRGDSRYLWSHGIAPRTTDKVKQEGR